MKFLHILKRGTKNWKSTAKIMVLLMIGLLWLLMSGGVTKGKEVPKLAYFVDNHHIARTADISETTAYMEKPTLWELEDLDEREGLKKEEKPAERSDIQEGTELELAGRPIWEELTETEQFWGLAPQVLEETEQFEGLAPQELEETEKFEGLALQELEEIEQFEGLALQELEEIEQFEGLAPQELEEIEQFEGLAPQELEEAEQFEGLALQELEETEQLEGLAPQELEEAEQFESLAPQELEETEQLEGLAPQELEEAEQFEGLAPQELEEAEFEYFTEASPLQLIYTDTIDLSLTTSNGVGYTVSGSTPAYTFPDTLTPAIPNRVLNFTREANGKTYRIVQAGGYVNASPAMPKQDSSIFYKIAIPAGVETTLVISGIHLSGLISIAGTGKLVLMLEGKNFINENIEVPEGAEISISSLNGNDSDGYLTMPSLTNNARTYARIGGPANKTAGTIIINGGTINISARSTGACIGGGGSTTIGVASPASPGGNGGKIKINGGVLSLTQYGSISTGIGESGACIGGGGGNSVNGGDGGTILISGGTINITQHTRAAGIGGGTFGSAGNITISGGIVNVAVIPLTNQAGAGEGAGIGASSGLNRPGASRITIEGGQVNTLAHTGPGIGIVHGNTDPFDIVITGGTVYAKSVWGAGIGCWNEERRISITITGGDVIAQSENNAGIGGPFGHEPVFCLSAQAQVRASSGSQTPAINTQNNRCNGYFVNARLNKALSNTSDTSLKVYNSQDGTLQKTLTLPATYQNFAYSSDLNKSRTDHILAYNNSARLGVIVRVQDSRPQIYSVISRAGYNEHNNNAYNCVLPVRLESRLYCIITEKYVDIYGNPLTGINDTTSLVYSGFNYDKTIPAIPGYTVRGYKWDSAPTASGTDYILGNPPITEIVANETIYFVYTSEIVPTGLKAGYTPFLFLFLALLLLACVLAIVLLRVTKKTGKIFLATLLLACLINTAIYQPAQAAEAVELILPVQQTIVNAASSTTLNETFIYRLAPELATNPMPKGSLEEGYTFSITGTDESKIGPFIFEQPGMYSYQISHITEKRPDYIFDQEVYTIEVYVDRNLSVTVIAYIKNGYKAAEIAFEHTCDLQIIDSSKEAENVKNSPKPPSNFPKTGDESQIELLTVLFCITSTVVLLCVICLLRSKQ